METDLFNMYTFLLSVAISFISGIIVSLVVWYVTQKIFIPKIEICKNIAKTRQADGRYKYQIKIINDSSKRDAYQIEIYYRILYEGTYFTINAPTIPILYCKNKAVNDYRNERVVPINIMGIRENKLKGLNNKDLLEKYINGTLVLEDFMNKDFHFEIVLSAFDCVSSARLFVNVFNYNAEELRRIIVEEEFKKGEREILVRGSNDVEYGDNY